MHQKQKKNTTNAVNNLSLNEKKIKFKTPSLLPFYCMCKWLSFIIMVHFISMNWIFAWHSFSFFFLMNEKKSIDLNHSDVILLPIKYCQSNRNYHLATVIIINIRINWWNRWWWWWRWFVYHNISSLLFHRWWYNRILINFFCPSYH